MQVTTRSLSYQKLTIVGARSVRVGVQSGLGPIWALWAHIGPYEPIYGPLWAHMDTILFRKSLILIENYTTANQHIKSKRLMADGSRSKSQNTQGDRFKA